MRSLREKLTSVLRKFAGKDQQQTAQFTEFQREFGLDRAIMETRKHVARKETAREGAYSLPVGFLVVGLVAIFLSNDEESMRDFVLRSKVLKWKVATRITSVAWFRGKLIEACLRYYQETTKKPPRLYLREMFELLSGGNLSQQQQDKAQEVVLKLLPFVEKSPNQLTVGYAEKLLLMHNDNNERSSRYRKALATICINHGNLRQQYIGVMGQPHLAIDDRAVKKFQQNSASLNAQYVPTDGLPAYKYALELRWALYILNNILAQDSTIPSNINSKVKQRLLATAVDSTAKPIFAGAIA